MSNLSYCEGTYFSPCLILRKRNLYTGYVSVLYRKALSQRSWDGINLALAKKPSVMLYSTLCCQNHKAKSLQRQKTTTETKLSRVGVWLWEDVTGSLAISKWDSLRLLWWLESCYSMASALKIIKGLHLYPPLWFTTVRVCVSRTYKCALVKKYGACH